MAWQCAKCLAHNTNSRTSCLSCGFKFARQNYHVEPASNCDHPSSKLHRASYKERYEFAMRDKRMNQE